MSTEYNETANGPVAQLARAPGRAKSRRRITVSPKSCDMASYTAAGRQEVAGSSPARTVRILAVLQNQWFRDPVRAVASRARAAKPERWDYYMLFAGCLTGRRLRDAFGDLCDEIVWANASPQICGQASACPPADSVHVQAAIDKHQPDVILLFGKVACGMIGDAENSSLIGFRRPSVKRIVIGPHPASRGSEVRTQLAAMADDLRRFIASSQEGAS